MRIHQGHFLSADEAVALILPGDLIRLPMGPTPLTLINALMRRREELLGVRLIQGIPQYRYPFAVERGWSGSIHFITDFLNQPIRAGYRQGITEFQITDALIGEKVTEGGRTDCWSADVMMALVSPPDEDGYVSFGYSLWYAKSLAAAAKITLGEVSEDVIGTGGDNKLHVSEFDYLVRQVEKPRELSWTPRITEEELTTIQVIGGYVSTLVDDGDTIQLGTGTISSGVGHLLNGKRDLGIDSEVITPAAVELVRSGVATGVRKNSHVGKAVGTVVAPGPHLGYVDGNPEFELYDVAYVNSIARIAANRRQVAVNQALSIDLTGQVNAETVNGVVWGGPGGQLAWTVGALLSDGGRSIHVLSSTARSGTVSTIVGGLPPRSVVTVPRTFVDFVVTEYGIVNMQGKTERERAQELISIAHPDFRQGLLREVEGW